MSLPRPHPALLGFAALVACSGIGESPPPIRRLAAPPASAVRQGPEAAGNRLPGRSEQRPTATRAPEAGAELGRYRLTYYWVADEIALGGTPRSTLRDRRCQPIAKVSRRFRRALLREGTGKLADGRIVNIGGGCRCGTRCFVVAGDDSPYGYGVGGRTLAPFRSIAAPPHIAVGTVLYIPELDGLTIPGASSLAGTIHNGCVVADDRGGGVTGRQIDLFTGRRSVYRAFLRRHQIAEITIHRGGDRCEDLDREGNSQSGQG